MEGLPSVTANVPAQDRVVNRNGRWKLCGSKCPEREFIFIAQTLLVYIVTIASIANLTYGTSQSDLWVCLLSSSIGYMLPAPSIGHKNSSIDSPSGDHTEPSVRASPPKEKTEQRLPGADV